MKCSTLLAAVILGVLTAHQVMAAPTPFALCYNPNGVALHNGATVQTIESTPGTNPLGLAFTGTNAYDFFSAPIATPISLSTSQKAGGVIVMSNSAPTAANDFTVSGSMTFYDYDPASGSDKLVSVARQPAAAPRKVTHGQKTQWILSPAPHHPNYTIPVGHQLHIVVSLVLGSGDPGSYGQLIYNGPIGTSTIALFPRNASLTSSDSSNGPVIPATFLAPYITTLVVQPDNSVQITGSGIPSTNYLIQATSDLGLPSSWTTISTNATDDTGMLQWVDADAPNHPWRFYRLATP